MVSARHSDLALPSQEPSRAPPPRPPRHGPRQRKPLALAVTQRPGPLRYGTATIVAMFALDQCPVRPIKASMRNRTFLSGERVDPRFGFGYGRGELLQKALVLVLPQGKTALSGRLTSLARRSERLRSDELSWVTH